MSAMNELLIELNDYLLNIGVDYAICGGHAIDLFVGAQTRPHKDLDVALYWDDRDRVIEYMLRLGWMVFEPVGSAYLYRINDVHDQKRIKSNLWCVLPGNRHYRITEYDGNMFAVEHDGQEQTELDYIEILFNHRKDDCFLYARDHSISRAIEKAVLRTDRIPYLAPEIVLLYKSTAFDDPDYRHDFEVSLPLAYRIRT